MTNPLKNFQDNENSFAALMDEMMTELESDPRFLPSEFWRDINAKNLKMLATEGLENFKRTVSQNYYNWLLLLKKNYPDLLKTIEIDRSGYVRRQFYAWIMQLRLGGMDTTTLFSHLKLLTISDWFGLAATIFDKASWSRFLRVIFSDRKKSQAEAQWNSLQPLEGVMDIAQFDRWITQKKTHHKQR
jgi:hypothetical protein